MSIYDIKISQLNPFPGPTQTVDFFPMVDSSSLTTYRTSIADIAPLMTHSIHSDSSSLAVTASYSISSSYAATGGNTISSSYAVTASNAITSSNSLSSNNSISASYAVSSSHAISSSYAIASSNTVSSSYAVSSSNSVTASYAVSSSNSVSSSYAITASNAISASHACTSSYAISSSNAVSSSYSINASISILALTASYISSSAIVIPIITGLFNTGVDANGNALLAGNRDQHWYAWDINAHGSALPSPSGTYQAYPWLSPPDGQNPLTLYGTYLNGPQVAWIRDDQTDYAGVTSQAYLTSFNVGTIYDHTKTFGIDFTIGSAINHVYLNGGLDILPMFNYLASVNIYSANIPIRLLFPNAVNTIQFVGSVDHESQGGLIAYFAY